MNAEERAYINQGFEMLGKKIDDHRSFLKEFIDEKDKSTCAKIDDLKVGHIQHDKRIVSLEKAYAKIAGISATVSAVCYFIYQIFFGN